MNQILKETILPAGATLQLVHGDLTEEGVDAIVNAANSRLQHGGGVAGAIARRGGPQIQAESDAWVRTHGPVPHDRPAYTSAGRLPCRYVIHAVGPIWGDGQEDHKLQVAIRGALELADQLSITSISFPAISTGIFGFPTKQAARIILDAIWAYFAQHELSSLQQVRIVILDQPTLDDFSKAWDFPRVEKSS